MDPVVDHMEWVPFGPPSDCLKTQEHEPPCVCTHTRLYSILWDQMGHQMPDLNPQSGSGPMDYPRDTGSNCSGPQFSHHPIAAIEWGVRQMEVVDYSIAGCGPHKGHLIKDLVRLSSRALMGDPTNQVLCGAGLHEAHYPPHLRSLGVNPLCKKTSSVRWVLVGLLLPFYEFPELLKDPC